ncbi:potassium inwardly rectifying channel subfamily J member 11, like isoform X1 [Festucalex cinctus]
MLARKGLVPDGFLLTRLAEERNQPNRKRSRCQRARFITKTGSCNVAHKNIREQWKDASLWRVAVWLIKKRSLEAMMCRCAVGSGSLPAGRVHHHGGPEVAALAPDLHVGLPVLVDAVRHGVVAAGLRSRRPAAAPPAARRRRPLRHRHQLLHLRLPLLHRSPGDHRLRRTHGDGGVPGGHRVPDRAEHPGPDHQRGDAGLRLHEDGAGQPARRDAHLLPPRRGGPPQRTAHLHVQGGRPPQEHDHLRHRAAAGDPPHGDVGGRSDPGEPAGHPGGEPAEEQRRLPGVAARRQPHAGEGKSALRPVGSLAGHRRHGGHRHPGRRGGDDGHQHAGQDVVHAGRDPVGPPLRVHRERGGRPLLRRLLQVRQHAGRAHVGAQRQRTGAGARRAGGRRRSPGGRAAAGLGAGPGREGGLPEGGAGLRGRRLPTLV